MSRSTPKPNIRRKQSPDENMRRTSAILENVVDGVITMDESGIIDSFNSAAEKIFGYREDEVGGKSINILIPEPQPSQTDDFLQPYLTSGNSSSIGCEECKFSGYNGRMAIYEMFVLTDDIRELIAKNSSILDIQKIAMEAGFKTLRYNGLKAVLRGVTTIEEVDQFTLKESELYVH